MIRRYVSALLTAALLSAMLAGCAVPSENSPDVEQLPEEYTAYLTETDERTPSDLEEPEPAAEPEPVPAEPVFTLLEDEAVQGSFLTVVAENMDGYEDIAFTDPFGAERRFIDYGGIGISLVPVKISIKPGDYILSVNFGDVHYSKTFSVVSGNYETQYLTVDEATLSETLENDSANSEYNAAVREPKKTVTPEKLWDGEFMFPLKVTYKITTTYGTYRTFSNGATEYHNAIDYAAKGGSYIYATNSGRVLFSGFLHLTGNTIIIDHGMGVLSWHYHMNERWCSTGEDVRKGDVIGTVGTTGLSTGNHLHFGMSVCGNFVNPDLFIGKDPSESFASAAATAETPTDAPDAQQ